MRCQMWRFVPGIDDKSEPGTNRHAWRLCRNQIADGEYGCKDCFLAAAEHPDQKVRVMVAQLPGCPLDILELLSTDIQLPVAEAADEALAERDNATVPTAESLIDLEESE